MEFNSTCSTFAITITLTKAGHEHVKEVRAVDDEDERNVFDGLSRQQEK
jgi:DNA-binding MarR family transcriptional regulator